MRGNKLDCYTNRLIYWAVGMLHFAAEYTHCPHVLIIARNDISCGFKGLFFNNHFSTFSANI